ncbi:MAG TPA: hypothetical protein VFY29_02310 [Terriglobia bacterium]|nr:hypothetical protein [Terriglobia bacterium]
MPVKAKTLAFVVAVVSLALSPALANHPNDAPWSNPQFPLMTPYSGSDIQMLYPEGWTAAPNGEFIYITPAGGFMNGSLTYGVMIGTFDPQSGIVYDGSLPPLSGPRATTTLGDATDLVVNQYRKWNQNIGMAVNRGRTWIGGLEATVVDMTNTSTNGLMQTHMLLVVLRPDGLVTYFVGIAPQIDFGNFEPLYQRMLASVRFTGWEYWNPVALENRGDRELGTESNLLEREIALCP